MKMASEQQKPHKPANKPAKMKLSLNLEGIFNHIDSSDDNKTPEYPLREDHPLALLNKERLESLRFSKQPPASTLSPLIKEADAKLSSGDLKNKGRLQYSRKCDRLTGSGDFGTCQIPSSAQSTFYLNTHPYNSLKQQGSPFNTFHAHNAVHDRCLENKMAFKDFNFETVSERSVGLTHQSTNTHRSNHRSRDVLNEEECPLSSETTSGHEINKREVCNVGRGSVLFTDKNNNAREMRRRSQESTTSPHTNQYSCNFVKDNIREDRTSPTTRMLDMDIHKSGDEGDKSPPCLLRVDQNDTGEDSFESSPEQNLPPALSPVDGDSNLSFTAFQKYDSDHPTELNSNHTHEDACPVICEVLPLHQDRSLTLNTSKESSETQSSDFFKDKTWNFCEKEFNSDNETYEKEQAIEKSEENLSLEILSTEERSGDRMTLSQTELCNREQVSTSGHNAHHIRENKKTNFSCEVCSVKCDITNITKSGNCIRTSEKDKLLKVNETENDSAVNADKVILNKPSTHPSDQALRMSDCKESNETKKCISLPICGNTNLLRASQGKCLDTKITQYENEKSKACDSVTNNGLKSHIENSSDTYSYVDEDRLFSRSDCNESSAMICDHVNNAPRIKSDVPSEIHGEDIFCKQGRESDESIECINESGTEVCLNSKGNNSGTNLSSTNGNSEKCNSPLDVQTVLSTDRDQPTKGEAALMNDNATSPQSETPTLRAESTGVHLLSNPINMETKASSTDCINTTIEIPHSHEVFRDQIVSERRTIRHADLHNISALGKLGTDEILIRAENSSEISNHTTLGSVLKSSNTDCSNSVTHIPSIVNGTTVSTSSPFPMEHNFPVTLSSQSMSSNRASSENSSIPAPLSSTLKVARKTRRSGFYPYSGRKPKYNILYRGMKKPKPKRKRFGSRFKRHTISSILPSRKSYRKRIKLSCHRLSSDSDNVHRLQTMSCKSPKSHTVLGLPPNPTTMQTTEQLATSVKSIFPIPPSAVSFTQTSPIPTLPSAQQSSPVPSSSSAQRSPLSPFLPSANQSPRFPLLSLAQVQRMTSICGCPTVDASLTSMPDGCMPPSATKCIESCPSSSLSYFPVMPTRASLHSFNRKQVTLSSHPPPNQTTMPDAATTISSTAAVVVDSPISTSTSQSPHHKRTEVFHTNPSSSNSCNLGTGPYAVASGHVQSPISASFTNSYYPSLNHSPPKSGNGCVGNEDRSSVSCNTETHSLLLEDTNARENVRGIHTAASPTPSEDNELLSFMSTYIRPTEDKSVWEQSRKSYTPPTETAIVRKIELCTIEDMANQVNDGVEKASETGSNAPLVKCESPAFLHEQRLLCVDDENYNVCGNPSSTAVDNHLAELPIKDFFTTKPDEKSYSSLARAAIHSKSRECVQKDIDDSDDEDVFKFLSKKDFNDHPCIAPNSRNSAFDNVTNGDIIDLTYEGLNDEVLSISSDDGDDKPGVEALNSALEDDRDLILPVAPSNSRSGHFMELCMDRKNGDDYTSVAASDLNSGPLSNAFGPNSKDTVEQCMDRIKVDCTPVLDNDVKSHPLHCDFQSGFGDSKETIIDNDTESIRVKQESAYCLETLSLKSRDTVKCLADHIKRRALKMSLKKKAEVSAKIHSIMVEKFELLPESLRSCTIPPQCHPDSMNLHIDTTSSLQGINKVEDESCNPDTDYIPNDATQSPASEPIPDISQIPRLIPDTDSSLHEKSQNSDPGRPFINIDSNHNSGTIVDRQVPPLIPDPKTSLCLDLNHKEIPISPLHSNTHIDNNSVLNFTTQTTVERYRTVWYSHYKGENDSASDSNTRTANPKKRRTSLKTGHPQDPAKIVEARINSLESSDPLLQKLELLHAAKVIDPAAIKAVRDVGAPKISDKSVINESAPLHKPPSPQRTHPTYTESNSEPVDLSLTSKNNIISSKSVLQGGKTSHEHEVSSGAMYSKPYVHAANYPNQQRHNQRETDCVPVSTHCFSTQLIYPLQHQVGLPQHKHLLKTCHMTNVERTYRFPDQLPNPPLSNYCHKNKLQQVVHSVRHHPVSTEYDSLHKSPVQGPMPQGQKDVIVRNIQPNSIDSGNKHRISHIDHSCLPQNGSIESINGTAVFNPTEIIRKHHINNECSPIPVVNSNPKLHYLLSDHIQNPPRAELPHPHPQNLSGSVVKQYGQLVIAESLPPHGNQIMPSYRQVHKNSITKHPPRIVPKTTLQPMFHPPLHPANIVPPFSHHHAGIPSSTEYRNVDPSISQKASHSSNVVSINAIENPLYHHYPNHSNIPLIKTRPVKYDPSLGHFHPRIMPALYSERPQGIPNHPFPLEKTNPIVENRALHHEAPPNRKRFNNVRPELLQPIPPSQRPHPMEQEFISTARFMDVPSHDDRTAHNKAMIYTFSDGRELTKSDLAHASFTTPENDPSEIKCQKRKSGKGRQDTGSCKKNKVDFDESQDENRKLVIDEADTTITRNKITNSQLSHTQSHTPNGLHYPTVYEETKTPASASKTRFEPCERSRLDLSATREPAAAAAASYGRETGSSHEETTAALVLALDLNNAENSDVRNIKANAIDTSAASYGSIDTAERNEVPSYQHSPVSWNENHSNNPFVGAGPGPVESRSDSGFSDSVTAPDHFLVDESDLEYQIEEYEENGVNFVSFKPLPNEDETKRPSSSTRKLSNANIVDKTALPAVGKQDLNETVVPGVNNVFPKGLSSLILASQQIEESIQRNNQCSSNDHSDRSDGGLTNSSTSGALLPQSEDVIQENDRLVVNENDVTRYQHSKATDVPRSRNVTEEENQVVNLLTNLLQKGEGRRELY